MKDKKKDMEENEMKAEGNLEMEETNEVEKEENEDEGKQEKGSEEEDLKEKYIRLYSEYENYRKRTAKEKMELIQTAGERVIKELLPVIDDFDRAFNDKNAEIPEGIQLIMQKMMNSLKSIGLKELEAKEKDFDPDFHDCITQFDAPSEDLKGKVIDVVEKGYILNDKVIRYAKVVVGK
ncbi:MAG: hypothetical protein RIR51_1359 [Bacteroidota bacterium]|jgi:molecular chaperone GrpE